MATKLTEARQLGIYNDLSDSQKEFVQNVINEANSMNAYNPLDILDFYDYVKTKGKWDVKSLKDEKNKPLVEEGKITNEFLGNYMYMVSGNIIGFSNEVLLSAAAAQQLVHDAKTEYDLLKIWYIDDLLKIWYIGVNATAEYTRSAYENLFNIIADKGYDLSLYSRLDNKDDFLKLIQGAVDYNRAVYKDELDTQKFIKQFDKFKILESLYSNGDLEKLSKENLEKLANLDLEQLELFKKSLNKLNNAVNDEEFEKFIKNLDANDTLPEQKIDFSNFSTDVFMNKANNEKFKAMLSLSEDELREHSMLKGQNIDGLDLEGLRVAFGEALFTAEAKAKVLATYTSLSSIGRANVENMSF